MRAQRVQQSVNLFREEFVRVKPLPSLLHAFAIVFLVLMLVVAMGSLSRSELHEKQTVLAGLVDQAEQLDRVITTLDVPPVAVDSELAEQLKIKKVMYSQRLEIQSALKQTVFQDRPPFSDQLLAFARHYQPGLTVTQFTFDTDRFGVEFSGISKESVLVPHFLKALRSDPALEHAQFGVLTVERIESSSLYGFHLSFSDSLGQSPAFGRVSGVQSRSSRKELSGWRSLLQQVSGASNKE